MSTPTPTPTPSSSKKTFTGSCHCGFIKYQAALPITPGETPVAGRCNCTICLKQGWTSLHVSPDDFELLAPASASQVKDYQMRLPTVHKYFCDKCGIHVWAEGSFEYQGTLQEFFTLNVLTLDQPQEGLDLSTFKIRYVDGRNDNWAAGPKDVPWPGGCV